MSRTNGGSEQGPNRSCLHLARVCEVSVSEPSLSIDHSASITQHRSLSIAGPGGRVSPAALLSATRACTMLSSQEVASWVPRFCLPRRGAARPGGESASRTTLLHHLRRATSWDWLETQQTHQGGGQGLRMRCQNHTEHGPPPSAASNNLLENEFSKQALPERGKASGQYSLPKNPDLSLSGPVQVGLTHAPPDAWAVS